MRDACNTEESGEDKGEADKGKQQCVEDVLPISKDAAVPNSFAAASAGLGPSGPSEASVPATEQGVAVPGSSVAASSAPGASEQLAGAEKEFELGSSKRRRLEHALPPEDTAASWQAQWNPFTGMFSVMSITFEHYMGAFFQHYMLLSSCKHMTRHNLQLRGRSLGEGCLLFKTLENMKLCWFHFPAVSSTESAQADRHKSVMYTVATKIRTYFSCVRNRLMKVAMLFRIGMFGIPMILLLSILRSP
jgi:hypothetical protein